MMLLLDPSCSRRGIRLRQWRRLRAYLVVVGGFVSSILRGVKSEGAPSVNYNIEPQTATIAGKKITNGEVVPKTAFSSKLRMSVMVGLEGTGHHYLIAAANNMFRSNDEISLTATPCINHKAYLTKSSMESTPSVYMNMLESAKKEMHDLALLEQNMTGPGHLVRLCSEASFPSGGGSQKPLQYVDLRLLAEVAEEQGIDLRVLYLKRSAHDLLIANTVHRPFTNNIGLDEAEQSEEQRFTVYALMLLTDAAVMHAFLAEIDPAFIVCYDYEHSGEEEQAWRVANFITPTPEMANMYASSLLELWKEHTHGREELPIEGAKAVVARLQRELDSFESTLCV